MLDVERGERELVKLKGGSRRSIEVVTRCRPAELAKGSHGLQICRRPLDAPVDGADVL